MKISKLLLGMMAFAFATSGALADQKSATEQGLVIPNFGARWLKSEPMKVQTKDGEYVSRAYSRLVQARDQSWAVGSITYFKYPKAKNGSTKFSYDSVLMALKDGMGIPYWLRRDAGDAKVFEGEWTAMRRFMRVYVRENKNSVEYSVAMMRDTYALPTAFEAEVIQRQLFGILKQSPQNQWFNEITASMQNFSSLVVSDACADSCDCSNITNATCYLSCQSGGGSGGGSGGTGGGTGGGTTTTIPGLGPISIDPTQYAGIMNQLNTLTTALPGFQNSINSVTSALPGLQQQLATANVNWANTNTQIAAANQNWANTNTQLSRALTMMQKEQAPGRELLQAGSTAVGAVLGASLATMAVDGLKFGLKELAEKFGWLQKQSDVQKIQSFKEMRETYEKAKDSTTALEAAMDATYLSMQRAAAVQTKSGMKFAGMTTEEILTGLGPKIEDAEADLEIAHDKLIQDKKDKQSAACISKDEEELAKLRQDLSDYQMIKTNIDPSNNDVCKKLSMTFSKLREAEGQLQHMRLQLYGDRDLIMKQNDKDNASDEKIADKMVKVSAIKKSASVADKDSNRDKNRIAKDERQRQDSAISLCKSTIKEFEKENKVKHGPKVFMGKEEDLCKQYVQKVDMSTEQLVNHFDPSLKEKAMEALDKAHVFSDAAQNEEQAGQDRLAAKETHDAIQAAVARDEREIPVLKRSGAASQGEIASLSEFFEELRVDQAGAETDPGYLKLLREKERVKAVCKEDWLDQELDNQDKHFDAAKSALGIAAFRAQAAKDAAAKAAGGPAPASAQ